MRPFTKMRRFFFVVCTGVTFAMTSQSFADETVDAKKIDVSPQRLSSALQDFSEQSGLQVAYVATLADNVSSKGTHDAGTAEAALSEILDSTGLEYQFVNAGTVAIGPAVAADNEAQGPGNARTAPSRMVLMAQASETQQVQPTSTASRANSSSPAENRNLTIEEIVVTAQKRSERLMDVPISISVLTGDELDRSTVTGITETLNRVPGVAATEFSAQGGGTNLTVRGVSASNPVFAGSAPVAYYLDSAPFGLSWSAIAPDANAYDLNRVEVLRGPQGTLYGASALNGVVRVLTEDANLQKVEFKTRGLTSMTECGGESYRADAALNLPLITDKLGARAVVSYEDRAGWIDRPGEADANDGELLTLRIKVNAQPTERLSIGASAWRSRTDMGAPNSGSDVCSSTNLIDEPIATDYDLYGLKLHYAFSGFSLSSSTSYLDYSNDSFLDLSAPGFPLPLQTIFEADTFAQEVNLISTHAGHWRWSLGGIYRDGEDRLFASLPTLTPTATDLVYHSKSFAIFGELTRLFFNDKLGVTAGLRYFEDELTQREDGRLFSAPAGVFARATFDNVSPRAVLAWHPDRQMTVYASYAEGFRSGSSQAANVLEVAPDFPPVEPDELSNYELGAKGDLWGGRLNVDAAVFYTDWQDVQQLIGVDYFGLSISALINSGSASGMGAEVGATVELAEGLTVGANVGWNDLTFDADVFSGGLLLYGKGERPAFSPEYTIGGSTEYRFPLGGQGYAGRLAASMNHTSEQQSKILAGGVIPATGDALTIGRMSFSVDSPQRWTATLFADNLNNEKGAVINGYAGSPERTLRIRPRTIGAQFEYKF